MQQATQQSMQQAMQQSKRKKKIDTKTVSIKEYIRYAEQMYLSRQGNNLERMLSLFEDHASNQGLVSGDIGTNVAGKCVAPLDYLLVLHLLCVKAMRNNNYAEANNHQIAYIAALVKLLQSQIEFNWMLPVMYTACSDMRLIAEQAKTMLGDSGKFIEKATPSLISCFKVCADDFYTPRKNSKLLGMLNPINNLLKMYFKAQGFGICRTLIKVIEPSVISLKFNASEEVTFRFYVGRLAMMDGDFRKANKYLLYAYKKCHPQSYKNKRIIAAFLTPVKMLLGYMPPMDLIEKYDLPLFGKLMTIVREGQIKKFDELLQQNRSYFGRVGLWSALQNLRMVTYRNVMKKVFQSMGTYSVPLISFQAGLQMMADTHVDLKETQSIVAIMIFNNKINAYLSYQQKSVIFNRTNPFPRLSQLYNPKFN